MSFLALSRFGAPLAALVLFAAACGGQSPTDQENAAVVSGTTTNFVLTGIDAQTAAPFLTCTTATSTTEVDSGTLAVGDTTYTAVFDGTVTKSGVTTPNSYQDKGRVSVSGTTYTFKSPGVGTFTGTLTNGTLMVVSDYTYCGSTHTLTYQLQ
ncbi:MAG TPA: hypothetical protein VFP21_10300 [Solirubrobacterales bacterium]|nr:hypothetical protein [Solirubrobacterales bacterium]